MPTPARRRQVSEFVEQYAATMVAAGIPRMPARVFSLLLSTDSGRRTAAEIAAELQVSPAAVSGAVRYLQQLDLVTKQSQPGTRTAAYHVDIDVWHEAIFRRDQMIKRWGDQAGEGADLLGRDTPAGQRMAETQLFFEFTHEEMPAMLERWRKYRDAHRRKRKPPPR